MNTWITRICHGFLLLCILVALLPVTAKADNTTTQTKYGYLTTSSYGAAVDYTLELDAPATVRVTYANTSPYYTLFTLYEDGKHWLRDAERPISGPSYFYLDSYYVYASEAVYQLDAGTYRITVYVENTNLHVYSEYALQVSMTVHEHSYTSSTYKPTCSSEGYTKYTCDCGDSYKTNYKDKLPHTPVAMDYVAPTCTETGREADGKKCSVCGEITKKPTTIPKLPHTEVDIPGKEPTCTKPGLTEGRQCSVCSTITYQEVIPALGHTYVERDCIRCDNIDTTGLKAYGRISDTVIWFLEPNGKLSVCGTGSMGEYGRYSNRPPWEDYQSELKTLYIGNGIEAVPNYAFNRSFSGNFGSLTEIIISDSVTSIGEYAFDGCVSLTTIQLSNNIVTIGDYAFNECGALKSIHIPKNVSSIGDNTFNDCNSISGITVDADNQYYASVDGVLFNKAKTVLIRYPLGKNDITNYVIPEGVKEIKHDAFAGNKSLIGVIVPDSTTYIGSYAFQNCTGLQQIDLPNTGVEIDWFAFMDCTSLQEIVLPDGIKTIGYGVFDGCTSLASVKIPDTVTYIELHAFRDCVNLQEIEIPESVTDLEAAFSGCTSLQSISIPDGITSIDNLTFNGCTALSEIHIPGSVAKVGESAFKKCTSLQDVYFGGTPEQWGSITIGKENDYLTKAAVHFQGGGNCGENLTWSLDKGVLTITGTGKMDSFENVADIPWYADRLSVKKIVIGDGVTSISDNAFTNITATVNYPAESSIWTESARQNYGGDLTWLPLCKTHDWGAWETVQNPTCTSTGKKVRTCKREGCGETETELIAATGHAHVPIVTAPTCAAGGYTTYTCVCGDSYTADKTAPVDHSYAYTVTAIPTVDEQGVLSGACVGCTSTVAVALPKLNKLDYAYQIVKQPTTDATGIGRYTWNVTDYGAFSFDVILEKLPAFTYGDTDGNGKIQTNDAKLVLQHIVRMPVELNLDAADVDGNGKIQTNDAKLILQYIVKIITQFPAEAK